MSNKLSGFKSKQSKVIRLAKAASNSPIKMPVLNSDWEEVEAIYQSCVHGLLDIAEMTASSEECFKDNKEIPVGVITAIRGLTRDLDSLSKDLINIRHSHKDKTGKIVGDEDISLSISIMQDYIGFKEKFQASTLTPIIIISEGITKVSNEQEDCTVKDIKEKEENE